MALMHQTLASSLKEAHAENGKMSGVIERGLANYEDYFQSLLPPPKGVQQHPWSKASLEASIAEQVRRRPPPASSPPLPSRPMSPHARAPSPPPLPPSGAPASASSPGRRRG